MRRVTTIFWMALCLFVGSTAIATAACQDDNRQDWNCSGAPKAACRASGNHSWGRIIAVNTANDYRKCSVISTNPDFTANYREARNCNTGEYVYVFSNQFPGVAYPNCDRSDLFGRVGNDTTVQHGLRGVGYY